MQANDDPLTREQWIRRYADKIKVMAEWPEDSAMACAIASADTYEDEERVAGNALSWDNRNPEEEAQEEMTYWDNDGGEDDCQ